MIARADQLRSDQKRMFRLLPANSLWPRPLTLAHVWAALALVAIFFYLNLRQIAPHDFWWHVRIGEWIVAQRRLPTVDMFSFTRSGQPWFYQSWLAEVALQWLFHLGGAPLVIFGHALLLTGAYLLIFLVVLQRVQGDLRLAALALLASAAIGIEHWEIRPQTFSFPLFALSFYLLDRYRRQGGRCLWLLPPLMVVWANTHGGFIFGLQFMGLYLLVRLYQLLRQRAALSKATLWHEIVPLVLAGLAIFVTPLGLHMPQYVLGFLQHDVTRNLNTEFQPASLRSYTGASLIVYCLVLSLAMLRSGYRPRPVETGWLLLFGLQAFYAMRTAPWLGMVAAPVLGSAQAAWIGGRPAHPGRPQANSMFVLLLGLVALLSLPWWRAHLPIPEDRRTYLKSETPVAATEVLCGSMEAPVRLFAEIGYASYVEWACPQVKVFVDTRMELYPPELWLQYLALNAGRYDWQEILERYQVTHLMLRYDNQKALIAAATQSLDWQELYRDQDSVLFSRRNREP